MAGRINISEGSPYAGADTVDIIIHGVGAHGAHPHRGKDPIVLGAQIVLALQTLGAMQFTFKKVKDWASSKNDSVKTKSSHTTAASRANSD